MNPKQRTQEFSHHLKDLILAAAAAVSARVIFPTPQFLLFLLLQRIFGMANHWSLFLPPSGGSFGHLLLLHTLMSCNRGKIQLVSKLRFLTYTFLQTQSTLYLQTDTIKFLPIDRHNKFFTYRQTPAFTHFPMITHTLFTTITHINVLYGHRISLIHTYCKYRYYFLYPQVLFFLFILLFSIYIGTMFDMIRYYFLYEKVLFSL